LPGELDKTGRVVNKPAPVEILWNDDKILYARFESFGFSFWRAQELSLFKAHKNLLARPLLDFGCGDGSFASLLFEKVEYGLDIDADALETAKQFSLYETTVQSTISSIPLADHSVRSVISNSVLEHLSDLMAMLLEINRVLFAGGTFVFTVPVKQFEHDLAKYFGRKESRRINRDFYHRNLLEVDEWKQLLKATGFSIVKLQQYQPDWFTFWFRMFRLLGNRGFAVLFPNIRDAVWKRYKEKILEMVKISIDQTVVGSNIFVVARKANIERGEALRTSLQRPECLPPDSRNAPSTH
jgi:SAM-dependent methyltransferase